MIKLGKIAAQLVSILGPSVGSKFIINRFLINNPLSVSCLLDVVIADDGGRGNKVNLIATALELQSIGSGSPQVSILLPGEIMVLEYPFVIMAKSDTDSQLDYYIDYNVDAI